MNPVFLFGCIAPFTIVLIILKLSGWVRKVNTEGNPYKDVGENEEEYGDRTDYL
jgi:hypothetical protein